MPTITNLSLHTFNPNNTDPIPQGQAHIDSPNLQVHISPNDVPSANGGRIEILTVTLFVRGSATHTPTQNLFAQASLGFSDGIFQLLISDESVLSNFQADLRAASELALKVIPQYQLSFTTRIDGFLPGQKIRFIDINARIDVILTIQTVTSTLIGTTGLIDEFLHNITAAPYIIDPLTLYANSISLSSIPINPRSTVIQQP